MAGKANAKGSTDFVAGQHFRKVRYALLGRRSTCEGSGIDVVAGAALSRDR